MNKNSNYLSRDPKSLFLPSPWVSRMAQVPMSATGLSAPAPARWQWAPCPFSSVLPGCGPGWAHHMDGDLLVQTQGTVWPSVGVEAHCPRQREDSMGLCTEGDIKRFQLTPNGSREAQTCPDWGLVAGVRAELSAESFKDVTLAF